MKRFLSFLALTLLWPIWRAPAWAQLTTLGVGGIAAVVIGTLITPSIVPQPASYFNQNSANGNTNDALKPNGGAVGAFEGPTTAPNSQVFYFEGMTDSVLNYATFGAENAFSGLSLAANSGGQPTWNLQRTAGGAFPGTNWWDGVSYNPSSSPAVLTVGGTLTGYATGYYPATASGGRCSRPPSVVWTGGGKASLSDPGFLCDGVTPTFDLSTIPGDGAQQSTGAGGVATTCASNSPISGQVTVTTQVAVAHGIAPGQTFPLTLFTPSALNTTYTALPSPTPTTLVGTAAIGSPAGTCPSLSGLVEGKALGGAGGTMALTPISSTNPFLTGMTGITSKNGQKFCGIIGEYGADSNFPGAQFASFVDDKGNALPGAPALVPWLNQGTANFTGYVVAGAQSPSSPALNVTAMNPYAISAATFNATTGFATFTATNPGFIPGSEFTVSGVTNSGPGSFNQTYVAVAGTSGTTIIGNPISGPLGVPQASSLTGSSVMTGGSSPQMVSVIMPNMQVLGAAAGLVIAPYGTFGGSGVGGVGTYGLLGTPATSTFTAKIDNGAGAAGTTLTTSGAAPAPPIVVGTAVSGAGVSAGTIVTAVLGASTFTVNNSQLVSTAESMTNAGTLGSSGAPVNIFAYPGFYYTAAASVTASAPYGGVTALRTQALFGDWWSIIGSTSLAGGPGHAGWGGALGNVSMLWGAFPQVTGGAPSTTALASLCKKTTDIQSFAATNSLTVHSLYKLNDLGIWGDSSFATITGYIDSASNTVAGTATLHVLTTPYGSLAPPSNQTATIAAPGLAGAPLSAPTIPLLSSRATSTYTVTFAAGITSANLGSISAPVTFSVGAFKPATPIASGNVMGYIDAPSSVPTLHVTSITPASVAQFTGTLGNTLTGNIPIGNTLNVTALVLDGYAKIGVGTTIIGAGIPGGTVVTGLVGTANGGVGSYTLNNSVSTAVPSEPMFASGILPAAADAMQITSPSGAAIANGMLVTDGNNQIRGSPIYVLTAATAVNGVVTWNINPTYYPANVTYTGMVGTLTTLVPGQYVQGATSGVGLTTPVSIIGYGTGFNPANGGTGDYLLSNNSANGIGSLGSPVSLITTGIGDGGAVAPGAALTIKDLGPGVTFPVTNFGAGTGTLTLSGTFDTSVLGGAPTTIQAQVSLSAAGPPVPGCSACAWTNLSGYSATLSSGTLFDWKGHALNIPAAAGPLFVSVRAANGTAYATMPSLIKVGLVFDWQAEGQGGALASQQSGVANSSFVGLWGLNQWLPGGTLMLDQGPPVAGNYVPGQTFMYAGDRFGVLGDGVPFPEGVSVYEQLLTNAFGWPATLVNTTRDGIGITPETMGNVTQSQSVGVGDGSTLIWCSQAKFCPTAGVSPSGPLFFNAATQTGANINASIDNCTPSCGAGSAGATLTTTAINIGALEPGMILTDTTGSITGAPTLVSCISGCIPTGVPFAYPNVQKWTISGSPQLVLNETMRADLGATPWPAYDIQSISLSFVNGGFGAELVKQGTFKVSVGGTVVCQDTTAFTYNNQSGNCIDTGGGIVSSGFVNYATGDYGITFASGHAPSSTVPISATWTNIISPDGNTTPTINRPQGLDFFGDGKCQSGPMSAIFCKTPGGVTGHVFAGGASDDSILSGAGFQFGAPAYTQAVSWLYGTRFPSVIPGESASTPFISANPWRGEGPSYYPISNGGTGLSTSYALSGQWSIDVAMKSTFSATIASGTLTLSGAATGPVWEGEVVDCVTVTTNCPLGPSSGVYITSLLTGAWGASGSTYALAGSPANVSTAASMQNAVYYTGPGPAFYSGPMNDIPVQASVLAATTGYAPHMADGSFAGRRVGARWACETWGGLTNAANCSDPTVDRVKADASGCDTSAIAAPCFDIGNTFAASHSGTISGAQITITGGIAAHDRPFVVGQALSCAGCTAGRFIVALDVPPTQSTASGAGEVGQTFRITANASLLTGPTTETVTAGCSGTAGTGSNCIDVAFQINTTNGSYGTAAALATCGENNLNGSAPPYQPPAGVCQTNGVGSLVRDFRVGTNQAMWGLLTGFTTGSPYDDGDDPDGGVFNQSAAFTANIVGAKVVQLVKAPTFSGGVPSGIGQWASGSTFVEYGDSVIGTGRIASLQGYVGGQSFPITTPGSGQTNGVYTGVVGTGCGTTSGGVTPKMDLTVAGNVLVNAYPSTAADAMGIGNGTACLFTVPGSAGGTPGTVRTVVAPVDGAGGIATYNTDSNMMGDLLYDNSGLPGNPLNSFFTNGFGGYFEPGLPIMPFGQFMGAQVSG